jgi:hypothetical protein
MAGIDLPPPAVAGAYIARFGTALMQMGEALGKSAPKYDNVQQAFLDAQAAKELIAAKSLAYDKVNAFNKELETNTDYSHFGETWTSYKTGIDESVSPMLTIEQAKQKFQEWWLPQANQQTVYVEQQSRQRTVAAAQAQGTVAIEHYADTGNEAAIKDTVKEMVSQGLWNASEATSVAKEWIPKARSNFILQQLDKLDDPQAAMETLNNPDASQRFQLDPAQVKNLSQYFGDQYASRQKIADARIKEQQTQMMTQFITDASDPKTAPGREAATKLMTATLGSPYFSMVEQYRNAIDTETQRITKEKVERGMTANYSQMKTSMLMWDGNGKPPWDPTNVDTSLRAEDPGQRISEPEANGLNSLYESTMKDLASGSRRGPNYEDPNKIADMMRIVFQDGPSVTDKVNAVRPFFANGVPPMKWQQIRGMIDEYNGREDWKAAMRPLNAYYNAAIQDPTNADKRQGLALEQGAAAQAMIDVFRKYPNDPAMWKQASDSVMDKNVLPQLINQVQTQLKASFPSVQWAFGGVSQATQLETARELAPKEFGRSPGLMAQTSIQAQKIADEEKQVLSKVGIKPVDSYRDPKTGAWFYSTVPFVRDALGVVDLTAAAKSGDLYQVQETTANGQFTRKPVKVRLK